MMETITDELPTLIATREDWTKQAVCSGMTDAFFPERGESVKAAKALCATCPVKAECLDFALRSGEKFGIWGGTSEIERRGMRRAMRAEMGAARTGPVKTVAKYDTAELVALALWAIERGEQVSKVISDRYGITETYARYLVSRARKAGHEIPYNYRRWVA